MTTKIEEKVFAVAMTVTEQRVKDLLTGAFEGGSGYWCRIMEYKYPDGKGEDDFEYRHIDVVPAGGVMYLRDCGDDDWPSGAKQDAEWQKLSQAEKDKMALTYEKLVSGLQVMADKFPRHFTNFIEEADDACTADVFLQCCLFNDVIYG